MKAILIRYLTVFVFLLAGLVALDFFNFPLSPFNYLNRIFPVDLQVTLEGIEPEQQEEWLEAEGGASLEIRAPDGELLLQKVTGASGNSRVYLQAGNYLISGSLPVIQDKHIVFYRTKGPLLLQLKNAAFSGRVRLVPSADKEVAQSVDFLKQLLRRGQFDRTVEVLKSLDPMAFSNDPETQEMLQSMRGKLGEGLLQLQTLQELNPSSYNSNILILSRMESLFGELTEQGPDVTVVFGGQKINPYRRKQALIEARDSILLHQLTLASESLLKRNYVEALLDYHQVLADPELWRNGQETSPELQELIDEFLEAKEVLQEKARLWTLHLLGKGVEAYRQGELESAQQAFLKVSDVLKRLNTVLSMQDSLLAVENFLQDIEIIVRAQGFQKQERWPDALDAYRAVSNINPLVRKGIEDVRSRYSSDTGLGGTAFDQSGSF